MSLKDAFTAAMEVPKPHFEIWVDSLTDDDRRSLIEAAPLNGISHRAFYDVVKAQGARVSKETLTSWRKANGYVPRNAIRDSGGMMREWCGCGASIRAARRDVLKWREKHIHAGRPDPEPEKQGSFADTQLAHSEPIDAYAPTYAPTINARIGFQPNA